MSEFSDAIELIHGTTNLFGTDGRSTYRRLARAVHPDRCPPGHERIAAEAFSRLNQLWAEHQGESTITTRRHTYRLGRRLSDRDIVEQYELAWDTDGAGVLTLPRRPADNDLVATEAAALRRLSTGDAKYYAYVPQLVESFRHRDAGTRTVRRAVVSTLPADGMIDLATVRASYPDGVDPRDAAWMWRRLLVALGYAHRCGVIHGAVLPENVLIQPEDHGVVLANWHYAACQPTDRIPAMVARYIDWYPPEIPAKEKPTPATDICLASRTMADLVGNRLPAPLRAFVVGCTLPSQRRRPQDAWKLLAEFDDLLDRLYGTRKFRPFQVLNNR